MPLQLITPPYCEPIDLSEARAHIRQDDGVDDDHIAATIVAARSYAENRTWRQLVAARYRQVLDSFPGIGQFGVTWGKTYQRPMNSIFLDRAPVQHIESIQYIDMGGATQIVSPSLYTVDYTSEPCRITPRFGQIWPIPLPQIGAVSVTFIAGFTTPFSIDSDAGTITVPLWRPMAIGDAVRFTMSGGWWPDGLLPQTDFFIVENPAPNVYRLSRTPGGDPIGLGCGCDGICLLGEVPAQILAWMRMRLGSLDVYREEAIAMNRGTIQELPFVDGLLDSYARW